MKNGIKTLSRITAVILTAAMLCTGCGEKARATTMKLARIEGGVGIRDEKKTLEPVPDMKLYSGYHVETGPAGYAWIDLDSVKLTKLDERSEAEVRQEGKELAIHLESGNLFFHVTEPLKEDETMEIRTSTMVVGIRGTCGWVEVPDSSTMSVCILEGLVECQVTDPAASEPKTASVSAGQRAVIRFENGQAEITVEQLKESDIPPFVLAELTEAMLEEVRPLLLPEELPEETAEAEEAETETEPETGDNDETEPEAGGGEPEAEGPAANEETPEQQTDDGTPAPFTDEQLRQIAAQLNVPDSAMDKVQFTQYDPYYWDAGDTWLITVEITNPETGTFASASVDCSALQIARNIYMYSEQ